METNAPGEVYLCQVNQRVSCAACCGLYNLADASRPAMVSMLSRRTSTFAELPRSVAAIDRFARDCRALESTRRPFPDFHHCPFVGLIGPGRSRVGCLLHPLVDGNQGVDFRGLSDYGGLACHTYFCPATHQLPKRYKEVLRIVPRDWHLYGLVVTETKLIRALFQWVEHLSGFPLSASMVAEHPEARQRLEELLALKLRWPFRPPLANTPCHYFFSDPPFTRPELDYGRIGAEPSPMDVMLRELVTCLDTTAELDAAERLLKSRLEAAARALAPPREGDFGARSE